MIIDKEKSVSDTTDHTKIVFDRNQITIKTNNFMYLTKNWADPNKPGGYHLLASVSRCENILLSYKKVHAVLYMFKLAS